MKNREHVCETGMLQGLFDSGLSGDQTAGIKQQIQRIKNKFRSVDSSFDSQRSREVFKSISGVGYMFHLPDGGEIIEAGLPSDALRCLDAKWFAAIKKMDEESKREVREAFDRMDSSWDNTLYASALGMCVHNSAMRRQLHDFTEFVFREDGMRGVVSVVSVGAEGKTVLLATDNISAQSLSANSLLSAGTARRREEKIYVRVELVRNIQKKSAR